MCPGFLHKTMQSQTKVFFIVSWKAAKMEDRRSTDGWRGNQVSRAEREKEEGAVIPAGSTALYGQRYAHSAKHAENKKLVYSQENKDECGRRKWEGAQRLKEAFPEETWSYRVEDREEWGGKENRRNEQIKIHGVKWQQCGREKVKQLGVTARDEELQDLLFTAKSINQLLVTALQNSIK